MTTKRFLILPAEGTRLSDSGLQSPMASRLLATLQPGNKSEVAKLSRTLSASVDSAAGVARRTGKAGAAANTGAPDIKVVKSLYEDGIKLVEASEEVLAALRHSHPGIRVIEEVFCTPALAPRVDIPLRPAKVTGSATTAAKNAASAPLVVEVVRGDSNTPVRGADVIAFRTDDDALKKRTTAAGKATFSFAGAVTKVKRLYVYHEEPGIWGYFKSNVAVSGNSVRVVLAPLDLSVTDSLRHFHKPGALTDGTGVRVGVIDSGAEVDHPDLIDAIEGGANCVPGSTRQPNDFGPDGAHGTHVAGTIAGRGTSPTGIRGNAPGAKLWIYRVFETGNPGDGSSFAVVDAIERAINNKCDIINLSLGFKPGVTDPAISAALAKARSRGVLAIAAAGNDGRKPVSFPGSDSTCVAVSAIGRKALFPATSTEVDDIAGPSGNDADNFIGGFSNTGADLDATGSGVGVVSTFPGGHGVMSGTSMASPSVAGVAARLLAANPAILAMPRDAARTDAARKLLMDACKSLGFGILFEGAGLPK